MRRDSFGRLDSPQVSALSHAQLIQLRQAAREIFDAALCAVDAREVTRRGVSVDGSRVCIGETELNADKPIYVVSIGKAAASMAMALNESLGDRIAEGLTTNQYPCEGLSSNWRQFAGGHPLPNSESLRAAQAAFQLLEKANAEEAIVIFAVSGGGSAMIEWPVNSEISLADLQEANQLLVTSGANIAEINTVRRTFSAVKGGKLAERAPNAQVVTLIISDTNKGDEASVAAGPSLNPKAVVKTASEIVAQFGLEAKLPKAILRAVMQPAESPASSSKLNPHYVLAENKTAIEAAVASAKSLGFATVVAEEILEQPIVEGCELMLDRLAAEHSPPCLISGGEFACTVRGDGCGGRNLETALRCAIALNDKDSREHVVVLSGGTDGVDGNSPAAGAIADATTLTRARALGLDAQDFLARSDSYSFLEKLSDAIVTGPTGTNVRDIRICLKL